MVLRGCLYLGCDVEEGKGNGKERGWVCLRGFLAFFTTRWVNWIWRGKVGGFVREKRAGKFTQQLHHKLT